MGAGARSRVSDFERPTCVGRASRNVGRENENRIKWLQQNTTIDVGQPFMFHYRIFGVFSISLFDLVGHMKLFFVAFVGSEVADCYFLMLFMITLLFFMITLLLVTETACWRPLHK